MQIETFLSTELAAYKAGFANRVAPERLAMMEGATTKLKETGIELSAKRVGDSAPNATLPNAKGELINLENLWKSGPLVAIFYRGAWCPYCNLELRAWQKHIAELRKLGATLVAISPQTPDNSMSTAEKNELEFSVLSDSAMEAARGFGIEFTLPPELVDLYGSVGNNLPELNGNGQWVLPIPATFVIDQSGTIQFAHLEADYRIRAEPAEVISLVRLLVSSALPD